ncbi:MAG: MSCRAMM family protein, partial [Acidimicrobiales bacterium]
CTTTATGSCSPPGNDGSAPLLPGRYQVTESSPPPGYTDTSPTQVVDLLAGEGATVTFGDAELVATVFHKTASGNINPAELNLAGAVFDVKEGSPSGTEVASCSSDTSGTCVTQSVLLSGGRYCWVERTAPAGLAGGASGCFSADNGQANQPIAVDDQGEFVAIAVKKVDAAAPSVGLPGAVFDLVRVPTGAQNSSAETFPPTSSTLVASATTGPDGVGTFPLQLPGYEYCAVETQAPPDYRADPNPQCTPVLAGSIASPAPVTTLTFSDTEETVDLSVFKYNSTTPGTAIPGAVYDLYVEGLPPPSGVPGTRPAGAAAESGDTWFSRGTTGSDGRLSFRVPAGYSWCVLEVSAPVDYVLDRALHCSAVLTTSSSSDATTIAVPETEATVHVTAYKYNSEQPNTVIADATYELLAQGAGPLGPSQTPPANAVVPSGDTYWAEGTTDANGVLDFAVPAGHSWCLHELVAPAAYQADLAYHCTAVLTTDTTAAAATVAVPELPMSGSLAFTGVDSLWMGVAGGGLTAVGAGAMLLGRRRRSDRAAG